MSTMEPDEGAQPDDQRTDAPRWEKTEDAEGTEAPRWEGAEGTEAPRWERGEAPDSDDADRSTDT
jgi:hypothetical protein